MSVFWSNGQWIDADVFAVSPRDRGLMHGLGLFETILAVDGMPFLLDRHLARLRDGARRLGWSLSESELPGIMRELLARNGLGSGHARLRLAVTGGSGSLDDVCQGNDFRMWITASAVEMRDTGLWVMISPWCRNEHSPLVGLKCASYAENLIALQQARLSDCNEVLLFNTSGLLCEAAAANVFIAREGRLLTPDLSSGCLPGITRGFLIELAQHLGIACAETSISAETLDSADEIFLSSSTRGPVPVLRLDQKQLPEGVLTRRIRDAWLTAVGQGSVPTFIKESR